MIERQPYLPRFMAGGESNPLGARALYLGNTVYRIHGTNQPSTIGSFVSSGCIRLTNTDVEDLYGRVTVGTRSSCCRAARAKSNGWRLNRPQACGNRFGFNLFSVLTRGAVISRTRLLRLAFRGH